MRRGHVPGEQAPPKSAGVLLFFGIHLVNGLYRRTGGMRREGSQPGHFDLGAAASVVHENSVAQLWRQA